MTAPNTATPTKVITPPAMLSYPHLDKPQPGKKPTDVAKYSCTLVYKPGEDLSALQAAALAAAEARWPGKAVEMFRTGALRSPFRKDAEAKGYAAGSVFQNVRTEQQPGCVYAHAGSDGKPAKVPQEKIREEFFPGEQIRASINFFAYDTDGNKGVSAGLNNIQKIGGGSKIAGRANAEDEFTADLSKAPVDISGLI